MKHFLLFMVIVCMGFANAQTSWCVPGAKWYYSAYGWVAATDVGVVYSYKGDTTFNNRTYSVIRGQLKGRALAYNFIKDTTVANFKTYYTYIENDVLYTPMGGNDTVVNYNAGLGDTWLLLPDCNGHRHTCTVTATGLVNYKSQNYRSVTVSCAFTNTNYSGPAPVIKMDTADILFVEKILLTGNWDNPFGKPCGLDPNIINEVPTGYFCGYEDIETGPLQLAPNSNCWKVSGMKENSLEKLVKVYPNPVKDQITLNYHEAALLRVFTAQGVLVKEIQLPESVEYHLNMENYAPGIYFFHVQNSRGNTVVKFIKE